MENYHVLELIGEGSFGKVYKGRKKFIGQVVALKFIPKVGKAEKELRGLRREIEIMKGLHHENIIEMLDDFETDKEVVVVTDYAEGELFQILEDDGSLPEEQVQSIACQLVSALFYLHSHRILHRDMKPQNILLGKGGFVKLCDFGFARAMSYNTLVLTSIKGTPLYMSPELVEEKPYDHTADLWAVGCILYELFTGTPPFYTNSIFQLVSLIIKDPVKWPKTMSPVFKDFLQGLLTKNPQNRLAWPDLLHHPFVSHGVKVSEEDLKLDSPFTQPMTASLCLQKEEQAKRKAHPPGTSKILTKARKKAMEEETKKKDEGSKKVEAWGPDIRDGGVEEALPVHPDRPHTQQWERTGHSAIDPEAQNVEPTPRPDRISKDYEKEYPSIEIEGRRTIRKSSDKKKKKNIETVKLEEQEVDSDDEWQNLIDATDQEGDPDSPMALLQDTGFLHKLMSRLETSTKHVLEGMLEGAARLRTVLSVVTNLVTLKCEVNLILEFVRAVKMPQCAMTLLTKVLDTPSVMKQPWCQQILIDLVITVNAYLASEISWTDRVDKDSSDDYLATCQQFFGLLPKLLRQQVDEDLRLREQTLLCVVYICEAMERNKQQHAGQFFLCAGSKHTASLDILLACLPREQTLLKKLIELCEGNVEQAEQRLESVTQLIVASLAALIYLPLNIEAGLDGKRKVAMYLGDKMASESCKWLSDEFLISLRFPSGCGNALKVVYSCCQVSTQFCGFIADHDQHTEALLGILMGKVDVADMEVNSVIEITLHIMSTIVIQLQKIPAMLSDKTSLVVSVFLESQIASHTAASALLFSQMVYCGSAVEVQPEEMLSACLCVFTDLAQICERCPFDYGVLDGLLLLLCELLAQGDVPVAQMYIETGIWSTLWHRVAQALQVQNPDTDMPIHDIEAEGETSQGFHPPDWTLVSPQGLMAVLQMAVTVFTKETIQCIPNLAAPDSIVMLTLVHLINRDFLASMSKSYEGNGAQLTEDMILQITQICCFPFAVDANEELLQQIQSCLHAVGLLPRLLHGCMRYLKGDQLETPMGLITRLVLGNPVFVDQFVNTIKNLNGGGSQFLCSSVQPSSHLSVLCDTISLCSHLVRLSPAHIPLVKTIFQGQKGDFAPLISLIGHESGVVKSRTCSLMGNLMKHNSQLYTILAQREKLLTGLLACLKDEDHNVRKGASYAVGNAAYHSGELYPKLRPAIPHLVELLKDLITKTRCNAAGACANFSLHSPVLCNDLVKEKVIHSLLDVACHDSQYSVQDSVLLALRSMAQQPLLKKEMISLKAVTKLVTLTNGHTPRPPTFSTSPCPATILSSSLKSSTGSLSSVINHCGKLLHILDANR